MFEDADYGYDEPHFHLPVEAEDDAGGFDQAARLIVQAFRGEVT